MLKRKIVFFLMLAILVFLVPTIANAAEEQIYKDTAQGIDWAYELDDSGNVVNLRCKTTTKTGTVTIPSKINGNTVISLSNADYRYTSSNAFNNCAGITGVTIPNTITIIGYGAFKDCTGLKSITIPDSVTTIKADAFEGCSGLTSVNLSKHLTSIGTSAFRDCTGLKSMTIPDSVTTIDEYAFHNCSGMKELTLSKNLTKINEYTFRNCSGLTSVKLPDSVTTLDSDSFANCKNLQKILIPDSVASIANNAFDNCTKLTIYGNDSMVSKEYAEEHKIPFDYIKNWDKASSGTDITAPTVKSITVTYASVMNYMKDANKSMYMVPEKAQLTINVEFSEVVQGTTAPTLTIKFGEGQNIQLTQGTVGGTKVTYVYTIKNTDKGVMTTVDYKGGNIKDTAGNAAKLSCPAVSIEFSSNCYVYANGTAENPNNTGNSGSTNNSGSTSNNNANTSNKNNNTNTPSTNNNANSANKNNSSSTTTNKTNTSTTDSKGTPTRLPQTGEQMLIAVVAVGIIALGAYGYIRYRRLRDI